MDGWKRYVGKKVFLRTKYNRVYSGKVISIDDKDSNIIFISLIDINAINFFIII